MVVGSHGSGERTLSFSYMRIYNLAVDVSGSVDLGEQLHTAVTLFLPDQFDGSPVVWFGYPGGGFGRGYYNIQRLPGYSQAEYHTSHGDLFVACDHLAVGESTIPRDLLSLSYEQIAGANHATAVDILQRLASSGVDPSLGPLNARAVLAMGQSMGGCLLTVQQANHHTFDGVAFLGWSGIHTNFPSPDGGRVTYPMPPRGTDLSSIADQLLGVVAPSDEQYRYCFHYPDEDPELMEPDLASYKPYTEVVRGDQSSPWGSASTPPCAITMMTEGAVAEEAAAIDVPVFVGCGERDVLPDPWAEPIAYRASRYVSVSVTPRMAHMHNFARTRRELWDRLSAFATAVAAGL
jgi:pimeloyl-ACP methyl ester carboxylesterase